MLDVLHSMSSPSHKQLHLEDNENDIFSTPPTTPMVPSSFARLQPAESNVDDTPDVSGKQGPSRRGSRPSSLHLGEDSKRNWTGNVELETGPPIARRGEDDDDGRTSRPGDNIDSDTAPPQSAVTGMSTPTRSLHSVPHQEGFPSQISKPQHQQQLLSASATSPTPEARSHMQENHGLNSSPAASTGTLTSSSNTSAAATDTTSASAGSSTVTQRDYSPVGGQPYHSSTGRHQHLWQPHVPLKSPCFVHSFLDKGASLSDWLKGKQHHMPGISAPVPSLAAAKPTAVSTSVSQPSMHVTQAKGSHGPYLPPHTVMPVPHSQPSPPESSVDSEYDDEEEEGSSLTRQLAETAVGVREMSKQLGRARIRSNIQNVLIITKARDNRLIKLTREIALYLMQRPRYDGRGLVVYVDKQLRYSKRFDAAGIQRDHPELFLPFPRRRSSSSNSISTMANGNSSGSGSDSSTNQEGQLRYWTSELCSRSPHLFDFVVTLGGDGTVLFTSWLFQRIVPPVLPFALGSLGFLTNFDFADHRAVMDSAIDNGIRVNLRMRFTCTVYRAVAPEPDNSRCAVKKADTGEIWMRNLERGGWEALEGGWSEATASKEGKKCSKDKEIMCFTTRPVESFEILNDLVVDRGPSPYMSLLELFGDEHHMTTVQADGLTIATPTGSTAYSLSAGGSLVHPEIPAILITPICPHTLSFRPMLLPDSMELRICVPFNSRSTAWASFDGRGRIELKQGDHIKVTASKYPFPTVCADKQSTDWFHAISRTLKWNERERQKSFVVVEEGPVKRNSSKHGAKEKSATKALSKPAISEHPEVDQDVEDAEEDEVSDDGEEEDDKFDIDDSCAPSSTDPMAMAKAEEEVKQKQEEERAREAAYALAGQESIFRVARDRSGTVRSGIQTPDRFVAAHPHPPNVSPRHVSFSNGFGVEAVGENGDRDHIHSPRMLSSGRSRIPRGRDFETESNMKTPTMGNWSARGQRSRSREQSGGGRAFAVWGQDESDSNASDSDV